MKETYQKHIVACIDLLGTKKAVESDEYFNGILNILTSFKKSEGEQEIKVKKMEKIYLLQFHQKQLPFRIIWLYLFAKRILTQPFHDII